MSPTRLEAQPRLFIYSFSDIACYRITELCIFQFKKREPKMHSSNSSYLIYNNSSKYQSSIGARGVAKSIVEKRSLIYSYLLGRGGGYLVQYQKHAMS